MHYIVTGCDGKLGGRTAELMLQKVAPADLTFTCPFLAFAGFSARYIYKKTGISRQTIHSAIRALEASGMLYLEQHTGRTKKVVLTDQGKDYIQKTAAKIYAAEVQALDTWTDDEVDTYLRLLEKYADGFRQQVELL